jgi:FkbM family methyltransferase
MKKYVSPILKPIYKFLFSKYTDADKISFIFRRLIKQSKNANRPFYFIQIGACDGKTGDPFFPLATKYNLSGILVEPVPYLFERLKANYKNNSKVFFENVAIGDPKQGLKFFRLPENPELPVWHNQLGSFKKEIILKHRFAIPDIENLIIEEAVEVISFEDLLKKYHLKFISLLYIDTEGSDSDIIEAIDFTKISVESVLFEHKHLSAAQYESCKRHLRESGFDEIIPFTGDTFCLKTKLEK